MKQLLWFFKRTLLIWTFSALVMKRSTIPWVDVLILKLSDAPIFIASHQVIGEDASVKVFKELIASIDFVSFAFVSQFPNGHSLWKSKWIKNIMGTSMPNFKFHCQLIRTDASISPDESLCICFVDRIHTSRRPARKVLVRQGYSFLHFASAVRVTNALHPPENIALS